MLVFVLHENSWEYDSYWCFGLQKAEEERILEGGKNLQFEGICWMVFGRIEKKTKYYEVCLMYSEVNRRCYVKMH